MKKQTAVEWYANASHELIVKKTKGEINHVELLTMHHNLIQQAKQMEKEQNLIELPTDEEIDAYVKSTGYYGHCTYEFREGIELGAKWMRDKIKGGNNE
jgi:hypothetical protein